MLGFRDFGVWMLPLRDFGVSGMWGLGILGFRYVGVYGFWGWDVPLRQTVLKRV